MLAHAGKTKAEASVVVNGKLEQAIACQQKHRLHRHPVRTIQALVDQHTELLTVLESQALEYQLDS